MEEKACSAVEKKQPGFRMRTTCDECPWRTDVAVGRFPPERFIKLRNTVKQGLNPLFACHKTLEGGDEACVGYLLVDGENNFTVRLAASRGDIKRDDLHAAGPLYESFEAMAIANGVKPEELEDKGPKRFWISWYSVGSFTYRGPWWESGLQYGVDDVGRPQDMPTFVAAVIADSMSEAMQVIIDAHDGKGPRNWRFCQEYTEPWTPFSERFPRADWMEWPA